LKEPISWTNFDEARYQARFQLFLKALEEEEAQMEGFLGEKMSSLIRKSMEDGEFGLMNWFVRHSTLTKTCYGLILRSTLREEVF
jgi:hypothetical protein